MPGNKTTSLSSQRGHYIHSLKLKLVFGYLDHYKGVTVIMLFTLLYRTRKNTHEIAAIIAIYGFMTLWNKRLSPLKLLLSFQCIQFGGKNCDYETSNI